MLLCPTYCQSLLKYHSLALHKEINGFKFLVSLNCTKKQNQKGCISTLKSGLLRLEFGVLSACTDGFLLRLRLGARARGCAAGGSPCHLEGPAGQRGTDGRLEPRRRRTCPSVGPGRRSHRASALHPRAAQRHT